MLEWEAFEWEVLKVIKGYIVSCYGLRIYGVIYMIQDYMRTLFYGFFGNVLWDFDVTGALEQE